MPAPSTWLAGVSCTAPPGWTDRSMLAFAAPAGPDGLPANVTLTRDPRTEPAAPGGETFDAYVARQSAILESNLPGFHNNRPGPLNGGNAQVRELLFDWRSGSIPLTQWVVWLAATDGSVVTFAATAQTVQFDGQRAAFEGVLRSLAVDPAAFPASA